MTALRLGSLFDGIGVFPLAAVRCGIEPVWASEIENAPTSILKPTDGICGSTRAVTSPPRAI